MKRILLIDHSKTYRALWGTFFIEKGFVVAEAETGQAALKLLKAGHAFDLVLLELYLPGMDGIEVLEAVRKWDVPVLALAEHRSSGIDLLPAAVALGAVKGLSKPIPTEVLLREVVSILHAHPTKTALERQMPQQTSR